MILEYVPEEEEDAGSKMPQSGVSQSSQPIGEVFRGNLGHFIIYTLRCYHLNLLPP